MKFYNIKDDFIAFLRQFDSKVAENKNQTRPYVGIVLEVNSIKYYAPFSSPKAKHKKMKNGKDFRKINNGIYGAINFNNMIPVLDSALVEIDIAKIRTHPHLASDESVWQYKKKKPHGFDFANAKSRGI